MADESIGRIYAQALFNLGRREQRVPDYGRSLRDLAQVIESRRDFQVFLQTPTVPRESKEKALTQVAALLKVPDPTLRLLMMIVTRRRLKNLPDIVREYGVLEDEFEGLIDVSVESAAKLDEAAQEKLEQVISQLLDKQIRVDYRQVPELMAGLVVRAAGKVFDCSMSGRLSRLEERMLCRQDS